MINNQNKEKLSLLKTYFRENTLKFDDTIIFPHENFDKIVNYDFHKINLPEEYGGQNLNISDMSHMLIELASGCSSTTLCLAMHYYTLGAIKNVIGYKDKLADILEEICINGQFIGSIGDPNALLYGSIEKIASSINITSVRTKGGYYISGIKHFVSGSPRIRYLPVYCKLENSAEITAIIVDMNSEGVTIDTNWKYSSLKSTLTNSVYFNKVFVPESNIIGREKHGIEDTKDFIYWFRLALVSVYQGIAQATYDYILDFIKTKKDLATNKTLAFLPTIQQSLAELRIHLEVSNTFIKSCCLQADEENKQGSFTDELYNNTLIAKQYVSETVNKIVWIAMQIQGNNSLNSGNILEKLYRDVRAVTFHPPSEYLLKEVLAKRSLGVINLRR
ncbi:acyl-CoA dehydrogenase family protein [Bacillus sp. BB56-3]|uniref:acyl-CoA dehydrogenase family protein n=1 Tax=Bacillus sp. BB56-3 TaxID=2217831 RepID=UPI0015D2A0A1|nr:acyl-CoA dehydrogenase family protein [Bacillus sp. BB56-3]